MHGISLLDFSKEYMLARISKAESKRLPGGLIDFRRKLQLIIYVCLVSIKVASLYLVEVLVLG